MDINGHLNNVAFAALFESGRVLLNREVRPLEDMDAERERCGAPAAATAAAVP